MNNRKQPEFGAIIKKARKAKGLTQPQLSELSGISQASIARIENGLQKNPLERTKAAILKALDLHEKSPTSNIDRLIIQEIEALDDEDKLTVLRIIVRLKSDSRKASAFINKLIIEAEDTLT